MTTTNNNTSIDSWLDWFQSRDSYIVISQSDQEKLFMSFSPNILKINCIDAVMQHNETAFLQKASFGEMNITIFHHLVAAGGTIYDNHGKAYEFIQGLRSTTASPMKKTISIVMI